MVDLKVNGNNIRCQADTGATCNVMSIRELDRIIGNPRDITMQKENKVTLQMFNGSKISSIGTTNLCCYRQKRKYVIKF